MRKFKFQSAPFARNRALTLALCILGAFITLTLSVLIASAVILSLDDPLANIALAALISLLFSAAVSGFGISKLAGEDGVKTSVICQLAVCLVILTVGVILGGGAAGIMNGLCYFGVGALFALLGKKRSGRPRKR